MFLEKSLYPVTAVCLEDTQTCSFSPGQFEELVLKDPSMGLQVILVEDNAVDDQQFNKAGGS